MLSRGSIEERLAGDIEIIRSAVKRLAADLRLVIDNSDGHFPFIPDLSDDPAMAAVKGFVTVR